MCLKAPKNDTCIKPYTVLCYILLLNICFSLQLQLISFSTWETSFSFNKVRRGSALRYSSVRLTLTSKDFQ